MKCFFFMVLLSSAALLNFMFYHDVLAFDTPRKDPATKNNNKNQADDIDSDPTPQPFGSRSFHQHPIKHKEWEFVYFQHIRKSGGSAFRALLQNNGLSRNGTGERIVSPSHDQTSTFRQLKNRMIRDQMRLLHIEYFPFYVPEYLKFRKTGELFGDVLLVTLLRDPLQRIFSDLLYQGSWKCNNIRYSKLPKLSKNTTKFEEKLIDCVSKNHAKYTANVYTKVFSGVWPYANPNNKLVQHGVDFNANMTLNDIHFELAKLILSEFDIILVLEMWNETKIQLKCNGLLNDTLPQLNRGMMTKNIGKFGVTLDNMPRLKQELIRWNQYDLELYAFATHRAMELVDSCSA